MGELTAEVEQVGRIPAVPHILNVISHVTGMGFVAVARVTEERWIACSVLDNIDFGLKPGGELKVETTICHEIRQSREPVIINNVGEHHLWSRHPTPAMYGFQSYISMPILLEDGSFFGTLCAIDPRPARLDRPEVIDMFRLFAELIASHVGASRRLTASELHLGEAREAAELREQFVAVLGHDLRTPLAAIRASVDILKQAPLDERHKQVVEMMKRSTARMAELIDNVLDFARGRQGGGLALTCRAVQSLEPTLREVVAELSTNFPWAVIETDFDITQPIDCDRGRIAQLFSNLLNNALTHGSQDAPIRVRAFCAEGHFELSIANAGEPIPPAAVGHLFQPFYRGKMRPNREGLGLGLFIAHQIATAHGGTLTVTSAPQETCFTFRMPIAEQTSPTAAQ